METLRCKTGTLKHVETGTSDGRAAFTVRWVEILVTVCERIWGSNVTANTCGGFKRNSAPLWARGQDAFLVIRGTPARSRPTAMFVCKADEYPLQLHIRTGVYSTRYGALREIRLQRLLGQYSAPKG